MRFLIRLLTLTLSVLVSANRHVTSSTFISNPPTPLVIHKRKTYAPCFTFSRRDTIVSCKESVAKNVPNQSNNAELISAAGESSITASALENQSSKLKKHSQQELFSLLKYSVGSGISCLSTWALVQAGFPPPRASAIQGILACTGGSPAFASASLSGAFTGMSLYLQNAEQAAMLAGLTTVMYFTFEKVRLLVGLGGRLGTISVVASMGYFALRMEENFLSIPMDIFQRIGAQNAVGIIIAASFLAFSRMSFITKNAKMPEEGLVWTGKAMLVGILAATVGGTTSLSDYFVSVLAMISSGLVTFYSPGKVLSMAAVGFIASYCGSLVNPLCIGGLMGMTSMPKFSALSLFESAIISTLLLNLNVLPGIGGRLGVFTILGVSLATFQPQKFTIEERTQ